MGSGTHCQKWRVITQLFQHLTAIQFTNLRKTRDTVMPAYSDTLGEWQKCHCKGGVTVTTCYYPGTKKTGLSVDDECVPIQIRSLIDDKCMPVQVKSFYG